MSVCSKNNNAQLNKRLTLRSTWTASPPVSLALGWGDTLHHLSEVSQHMTASTGIFAYNEISPLPAISNPGAKTWQK
jgi:hypothetical protein